MGLPIDGPWNVPPGRGAKRPQPEVHSKSANQGNEVAECNIVSGDSDEGEVQRALTYKGRPGVNCRGSQLYAQEKKEDRQGIQPEWTAVRLHNSKD